MKSSERSSRSGRWLYIVAALVVVVVAGLWFRHHVAGQRGPHQPPPVPVTIEPAKSQDVEIVLHALGTVTPVSTVTMTSRVAGILQQANFTEGQMVKQNDLLAVIDPRPYAAALAQAQGQLARDEAQLANARIDLERYRAAVAEHAISEQQAETQQAAVKAGEGTVQLDRAGVEAAQVNLDYTRIVSPIDGRVGLRQVDPGNNIPANGTNGIVTVTQMKPMTVVFTLAQDELARVREGIRNGAPMHVEAFDRQGAKPIGEGKLLTIDNQIDQATGTFRLKAEFGNEDLALWPGAFVNLRFIIGVRPNATTVPNRAVQRGPNGTYVFVVKPDMTVELRDVAATPTDQGITVIDRGIQPGESIVVDGQYRLEPGTRVAIQKPAAAGSVPAEAEGEPGSDS